MSVKIKQLYLCNNRCSWEGGVEPTDKCPKCGAKTFITPAVTTGCSLFYKLGNNLRIRNTGVASMTGEEAHVEAADIGDLFYFMYKAFIDAT